MQYFKVKNKTDMMIAYDPDSNVVYELEETSVYLGQLAILPILQGSTLTGGVKPERKSSVKKAKQIGVGRGRGVIHCKNCGKPGHQRKTCPNGDTSHAIDAETGLQEKKIQLTPDKLNRIKKMLGEGVAQATIGDEVGVSEETVERIADSLGI